jgi:hypothetical protein
MKFYSWLLVIVVALLIVGLIAFARGREVDDGVRQGVEAAIHQTVV